MHTDAGIKMNKKVLLLLYFLFIQQCSICFAKQSDWTEDIWKETIKLEDKGSWWNSEEKARKYAGKLTKYDKEVKLLCKDRNARVLEIKAVKPDCRYKVSKFDRSSLYRCRNTMEIKFQKRRDLTFEEEVKVSIAEDMVRHAFPSLTQAMGAWIKYKSKIAGAILKGTAPAMYGQSLKQTLNRVKRLKRMLKDIRNPSMGIYVDKIESLTTEIRTGIVQVDRNYNNLSNDHLTGMGFPTTPKEMYDRGNDLSKEGKLELAHYWFKKSKAHGHPDVDSKIAELEGKLKKKK